MRDIKNTKIGKIITSPLIKGLIKSIPFGVGSLAGNVLDEVEGSPSGAADWKTITPQLIKLGLYAVLVYLILNGTITADDAKDAQKILNY